MKTSFFGKHPGNSFIITGNYPSIEAMEADFKKGYSPQCPIHFDEYVIINSKIDSTNLISLNNNDPDNPDNNKVFRRGYDFQNQHGGAQYIGKIITTKGPNSTLYNDLQNEDSFNNNFNIINSDDQVQIKYVVQQQIKTLSHDGIINNNILINQVIFNNKTYLSISIPYSTINCFYQVQNPSTAGVQSLPDLNQDIHIKNSSSSNINVTINIPYTLPGTRIKEILILNPDDFYFSARKEIFINSLNREFLLTDSNNIFNDNEDYSNYAYKFSFILYKKEQFDIDINSWQDITESNSYQIAGIFKYNNFVYPNDNEYNLNFNGIGFLDKTNNKIKFNIPFKHYFFNLNYTTNTILSDSNNLDINIKYLNYEVLNNILSFTNISSSLVSYITSINSLITPFGLQIELNINNNFNLNNIIYNFINIEIKNLIIKFKI